MRTAPCAAAALLLISTSAGAARADDALVSIPGFATLDRVDGASHVDISSAFTLFDGDDPDFNNRLDFHAQYVAPSGFGGYAALPFSILVDEDTETAVGNLELGAVYAVGAAPVTLVLRGGLALATADDDPAGAITNLVTIFGRFTDLVSVFPDTTWLRLGASPLFRQGKAFFRADVGIDVPIDTPENVDIDPFLRVNLGGGFETGAVAVTAELVTLGFLGDVDDDVDRFLHMAAFSLRARTQSGLQPFVAASFPIDIEDNFIINVSLVVIAGLRIPINR